MLGFLPGVPASLFLLNAKEVDLRPCLDYISFPTVSNEHTFFTATRKFLVTFDLKSNKVEVSTSDESWCLIALADLKGAAFIDGQYLYNFRKNKEI